MITCMSCVYSTLVPHALGSHPVGMGDVQRHPCTRVWWFGGIVIHDARSIRYALRIVFR